jgi:hypothetical protein
MPRSPRRRIRLVTVIGGLSLVTPGRADVDSANLTPATGARTTRFNRPHQRRSSTRRDRCSRVPKDRPATALRDDAAASTASHPASPTIMIRPSVGWDGKEMPVICGGRKGKCFCGKEWTRQIRLNLLGKLRGARGTLDGLAVENCGGSRLSRRSVSQGLNHPTRCSPETIMTFRFLTRSGKSPPLIRHSAFGEFSVDENYTRNLVVTGVRA